MKAVGCQPVRRDIISELAGTCDLDQQISYQVAEHMLRPGSLLTAMQERHQLGSMPTTVIGISA